MASSWQQLMAQGNQAFHRQQWQQALQCYRTADELLRMKLACQQPDAETLLGWICGCHNLAALYQAQGEMDKALECLNQPHDKAIGLINSNEPALSSLGMDASRITYRALMEFQREQLQLRPNR